MGFRIVIVDDDDGLLFILSQAVSGLDAEHNLCRNGCELIETLRANDMPALIFLDIHMDQMDGIQAIEELTEFDQPIRLRFITGGDTVHAVAATRLAQARNLDVGPTLYKPFSLDRFLEAIQEDGKALIAK